MIDAEDVRRMSQTDRRRLARVLAELDGPGPDGPDPDTPANPYLTDPMLRRQRRLALLVSAACCVILAFVGARRLLRATVEVSLHAPIPVPASALKTASVGTRGPVEDPTCSLRRTRLSGHGLDEALPRGRAHRPAERPA